MTSFAVSRPQDAKEREAGKAADRLLHPSLGAGWGAVAPQETEDHAAAARNPTALGNLQLSASQSLGPSTRELMEPKFGADFRGVRVHTDRNAIGAANALGANAFTAGSDIGFAAGRYAPDSPTGRRLLAHELAHVVQNAGNVSPSTVYRDPVDPGAPFAGGGGGHSGGGGASGSFDAPATGTTGLPAGSSAGTGPPGGTVPEVIELKGKPLLAPSPELAQALKDKAGGALLVRVRFGELAEGFLPIVWSDTGFLTPPPAKNFPAWGIPMTHPAFPVAGLAKPTLWIEVRDSVVGGAMGWITAAAWANDPSQFKSHVPLEMLFGGLSAFTNLVLDAPVTDTLWNGRFVYEAPHLTFDSGPFSGSGRIRVDDGTYGFDATIEVPLTGLPKGAKVPVKRPSGSLENVIFGSKTWRYERTLGGKSGSKISGELTATLGNGSFDVRGTAGYSRSNPRIRGTVTIVVGSLETARQAVTDRLGPDAPASIEPAAPGEGIAIAGFGQLDFELSDWMTGNAEVIVHPEGWVTARGEILPTKIIPLFRKQAKEREIPGVGGSFTDVLAGVPLIGDVRVEADAQLYAYGWFGPGTLHDIRVTGLISNHPAIVNRFELAGTISSPAAAGLRLEANIGLSAYAVHLKKVAEAKLTGQGTLELQMYAEATAAAGRRASKAHPNEAEHYLQGSLAAAAALILDLQLKLRGDVLGFWRPNIHLIDQTYTLGQAGAKLNFEYVFGKNRDSTIEVSFDKISFDAGSFAAAVVRGETVTQKGYEGKTPVAADTTSDVVNPDAPPPGPVASGAHTPAQLEEPFSMYWAPHTLRLSLLEPPDLQMESAGPERLLNRISRARKNVRQDAALSVLERDTRLSDLDKIAAQARQVLDAAEKVEKGSRYLTPSVPGFANLAQLIADYGTRYRTTDLAAGLASVSVDPTNPKTVLNKFPKLADDALITARVGRILDMGVSATVLRRIVDNHPPSAEGQVVDLLEYIETMILARTVNWEAVLTDLKTGGNKLKGATFVLRYIATYGDWSDLTFEAKDEDAGQPDNRRWDTLMSGTLYEFKAWYVWKPISSQTFLKQILQDYLNNGVGETMPLKWVFGPSPLSRVEILANMGAALDEVKADLLAGKSSRVPGYYSPAMCDTIKSRLNSVVVKVT
ncbi:eCIS core domain-containing protein [Arthrobacter sp. A5]|uniref:eCIS core domain-containing protein n=1 Tax=Arthrobacter sp. A5 TaxID=576926 RepID=UPI003DA8D991